MLVRDLAAAPEGQVERQYADDPVDEAACHEAGAREDREQPRVDEALAGCPRLHARGGGVRPDAHGCLGTQTVTAFGSTLILKDLTFTRSPPSIS